MLYINVLNKNEKKRTELNKSSSKSQKDVLNFNITSNETASTKQKHNARNREQTAFLWWNSNGFFLVWLLLFRMSEEDENTYFEQVSFKTKVENNNCKEFSAEKMVENIDEMQMLEWSQTNNDANDGVYAYKMTSLRFTSTQQCAFCEFFQKYT